MHRRRAPTALAMHRLMRGRLPIRDRSRDEELCAALKPALDLGPRIDLKNLDRETRLLQPVREISSIVTLVIRLTEMHPPLHRADDARVFIGFLPCRHNGYGQNGQPVPSDHAAHLTESRLVVIDMLENVVRDQRIEHVVMKRHGRNIAIDIHATAADIGRHVVAGVVQHVVNEPFRREVQNTSRLQVETAPAKEKMDKPVSLQARASGTHRLGARRCTIAPEAPPKAANRTVAHTSLSRELQWIGQGRRDERTHARAITQQRCKLPLGKYRPYKPFQHRCASIGVPHDRSSVTARTTHPNALSRPPRRCFHRHRDDRMPRTTMLSQRRPSRSLAGSRSAA